MTNSDSDELIKILTNAGVEGSEAKKEISILELEIKDKEKIKSIVDERIKTRTPIQYLIGKAYFMDFEVNVNPNVLIPRPETEILVEEAVKKLLKYSILPPEARLARLAPRAERARGGNTQYSVLDIGTGSGIIPIALAKLIPNVKITAIDVNKEIIDLAYENAKLNKVEQKIDFKVCDLFSAGAEKLFASGEFDLIISNPPYVKPQEMRKLKPEVYIHEPKIALCGSKENKSGLIYYERIIKLVKKYQTIKLLAFEIDPPLIEDLKSLLKKENLNNFEIVKDYSKLDRCLFIYIPFVG